MNAMTSLRRLFLVFACGFGVAGCVVVPVPVDASIEPVPVETFRDGLLLTASPRRMIEDIADHVIDLDSYIEIVDSIEFRDRAYPEGGWLLENLWPQRVSTVAAETGVQYLVLIGRMGAGNSETVDDIYYYMPLGGVREHHEIILEAAILRLDQTAEPVWLRIKAEGEYGVTWIWPYSVSKIPLVEEAAIDGIAAAIVGASREHSPSGPVRIAILAAEGGRDRHRLSVLISEADRDAN